MAPPLIPDSGDHSIQPVTPLRELSLFNQVQIDAEVHTLVWPNGADFDPAILHDWPRHAQAFANRARQWKRQSELSPATS